MKLKIKFTVILPLLLLLLAPLAGCRQVQPSRQAESGSLDNGVKDRGDVEVTGGVKTASVIEMEEGSLGIREAVLKAGGPVDVKEPSSDWILVVTDNRKSIRWFVPWNLIDNEKLGTAKLLSLIHI